MKNDLTERYIYAVTRRLPRKQREDVSMELRCLIDDMLTERCGDVLPTEKDIRVVLTELGTPQELYAKYDEEADRCLIGQPYYSTYKFVMGIVAIAVTIGMTVSSVILQLLEPQSVPGMLGRWFTMVYNSLLASFAIVTLLFAFFQHKGIRLTEPFNFDDLPPVPKKTQEISRWESIAGIMFCVIFAVLFLFTPQVFCVIREGLVISLFEIETVKQTWFIIVAFAACGIIRESVQLMEGRYNKKVMVTALAADAVSALLSVWWLVGFDLINQTFLDNLQEIFAQGDGFVISMFSHFDLFFLSVMLFALALDAIDVTIKTLRR